MVSVPENDLEHAIRQKDMTALFRAVAEEETLSRLHYAAAVGCEEFTDEAIFAVMLLAMPRDLLEKMDTLWFIRHMHAGERLQKIAKEALAPLPQEPTDGEKALIRAIMHCDNSEVIRLIREEKVKLCGFAPQLLLRLVELSREAALCWLKDGLSAKLKALVLGILLAECSEKGQLLAEFSYAVRLKFANLMLALLMQVEVSPADAWYPETQNSGSCYSYFFDPAHRYEPFSIQKTLLVKSDALKKSADDE